MKRKARDEILASATVDVVKKLMIGVIFTAAIAVILIVYCF